MRIRISCPFGAYGGNGNLPWTVLTWPRPLPFPASLSQHASIHACLVCGCTLTHCVWPVCRICGSCRQQSLWYPQVALASVNIFHAVIATEKHVRYGWHYFVTLVVVVGGAANSKSAVDDFVKLKRIESLACVINSSERNDFLRFYVYLCHMSDILYLSFKQH